MKRESLKFLHLADLHLGCSFIGGRLRLPVEKARIRESEQQQVLARAIDFAAEQEVELILIAGDLWEETGLGRDLVAFVMETLAGARAPVVIAPGNHDFYAPGSHYSDEIARLMTGKPWHDKIYIIRSYEFAGFEIPDLPGVSITGAAYHSRQSDEVRPLGKPLGNHNSDINICIFHGTRDGNLPPGKLRTLPFSDEELLSQSFDYTALGHFHTQALIADRDGRVRAAYPGSSFALAVDEEGPHGCLVGTIRKGGVHPAEIALEPFDPRRIYRIRIDVTGLKNSAEVERDIADNLIRQKVRKDDMALVELAGFFPCEQKLQFSDRFLSAHCFHLEVDASSVKPEWDIAGIDIEHARTTEELFKVRLKSLIDQAQAEKDGIAAARLKNALYYGLDALHNQPILPRRTLA